MAFRLHIKNFGGKRMNNKQNLHTHTTYCDGINTPEEMILAAIDKNFDSLGFSGHSYMYFCEEIGMSIKGTEEYKKEIKALKQKYEDKIDIFCGLEFEMCSKVDLQGYDYLIGTVHYMPLDGYPRGIDRSAAEVKKVIDTYFNGDGMAYAKEYYRLLAELPKYGKFDILGHFDLITKHADNVKFFDEDSKEYKTMALEAAESLARKIPFFEINTGAIARGYRKTPYPSVFIIKELKRLGFGAVITSDCHNKDFLDCGFDDAVELLKNCGFNERYILTKNGFKAVSL